MSNFCRVCFCAESFISDKDGDEETSHSLINWQKWLERRERICKNLSKSLERPPEALLLNYAEEYRKIQEERLQIEYTNINTYFDKYRGNPEFWTLPYGLTQRCKGCKRKCDPVYFSKKTKPQRNEIPSIDYVGIPEMVLEQKHLMPRIRSMWKVWQKSNYRTEKLKQLQPKIKEVASHIPQTDQLFVQAQKLFKPVLHETEEPVLVPPKQDPAIKSNLETTNVFEVNSVPRIAFEINDMYFSEDVPFGTKTITLDFSLEGKEGGDSCNILRFNNKGRVVLRIHWQPFIRQDKTDQLAVKQKLSCFLFDVGEILLCPGSSYQLPVWFKPTHYSAYQDCWKITTVPKLSSGQILVEFQGVLSLKDFKVKFKEIKDLLDRKVRIAEVKNILNSVINLVTTEPSDEKVYRFTKRQLFESSNLERRGVERRLKYAYDGDVVRKLERFYYAIKQPGDPETWNFSVDELGPLARRKDIIDFARYQTKHVTSIRVARSPKKLLDHQSIFGSNYKYFTILRDQLVMPLMVPFSDREKYLAAFFVLRVHFWKMCRDLEGYDDKKDYYPSYCFDQVNSLDNLADRLVQEKFQDIWLDKLKRGLWGSNTTGTPKSPKVKNIPTSDIWALLSAYNKPDQSASKKTKATNVEGLRVLDNNYSVRRNENFNPFYDERFDNATSTTESSIVTVQSIPTVKIKSDYYTTYVIIYTHLCSAIDGIVTAVETPNMKYDMLTLDEIHELKERNVIKIETPPPSEEASIDAEEEYEGYHDDEDDEETIEYATSLLENVNIQKNLIKDHINIQTPDTCILIETTPLVESEVKTSVEDVKVIAPIQECGIQTERDLIEPSQFTSVGFSDVQLNKYPPKGSEESFEKLRRTPQASSQKLKTNEGITEFFYIKDYPGDKHNEN